MYKHLLRASFSLITLAAILVLIWMLRPELYIRVIFPSPPDLPAPSKTLRDGQQGHIHYPSKTYYDLDILLADPGAGEDATGAGDLYLPESAASDVPVPAMIVVHGSGGIQSGREDGYAKLLNQHGIAAFVIDYYTPRGADDSRYMLKVLSVTEFDVISDIYHALAILRTHPDIDPNRIGAMGMSYGGMAVRFALDKRIKQAFIEEPTRAGSSGLVSQTVQRIKNKVNREHSGLAAAIDIYGPCFQNLRTTAVTPTPLLTLRGTEDASNDLAACALREEELRDLGLTVEIEIYEGAGHAWENSSPRELKEDAPYAAGCEMTYDTNGFPSVNNQYIIHPALRPNRETRILNRMRSGDLMEGCVHYGYIIGRDDVVREQADQRIVRFLREYL